MDMKDFIDRAGLLFDCNATEEDPDEPMESQPDYGSFSCTFRSRTHEIAFRVAVPLQEGRPGPEDAMRFLGNAAVEYEACDDAAGWAEERGLDPDDEEVLEAFDDLGQLSRDLWQLLGQGLYHELCREIEIETAVDMVMAVAAQGSRQ